MELENELKVLIVESLALEDVVPADIDSAAPLFRTGLGLDSIDALELAMAIHKKFGVRIEAEDARTREIFQSVRTLAQHIAASRTQPAGAP
ncbi:MAG: acyl carrier protein [Deltaproteobacteria bacterium]|nr:acyl carrier protein [Deltaproteobacteria bacterium]